VKDKQLQYPELFRGTDGLSNKISLNVWRIRVEVQTQRS